MNVGKLLCTVAVCVAAGLAAVGYLAVTGVSIRDLYKSCKQVIQVKEEGLVTVQSLQPVLTPITPIAGKIGCDEIGDAVGAKIAKAQVGGLAAGVGALGAAIVAQAVAVTMVAIAAGTVAVIASAATAGVLAVGGLVALGAAGAYVYKRGTAQASGDAREAATFGIELAKGGNTHMHYTHAMFYPCTLVIAKPPYPKT